MTLDRRLMLKSLMALTALPLAVSGARSSAEVFASLEAAETHADAAHDRLSAVDGLKMHGSEQVAMLLYPSFTALDLVGPHFFLAGMMGARVHLVSNQNTLAPVASDHGLAIQPTVSMDDCPEKLTVLFVPGGMGTVDAMKDAATRRFIADREPHTDYMTSVCTGSLLLAASSILKGRRATSHWAVRDLLEKFGARPSDDRVVEDGNVITGAGVSAGIDFAITLVEKLRGRAYAELLMLASEYAPQPPMPGGTVETTPAAITGPMREMYAPMRFQVEAFLSEA